MAGQSVFAEEWRECLREHYKYVIRNDDQVTLKSLLVVLHSEQVGFTEDEIRQLYLEATMRADDLPADFLPDESMLREAAQPVIEAPVSGAAITGSHPLECQCPECVTIPMVPHDDEGQRLEGDALAEHEARQAKEEKPQQLSLF